MSSISRACKGEQKNNAIVVRQNESKQHSGYLRTVLIKIELADARARRKIP